MYSQNHLIRAIFFDIPSHLMFLGLCVVLLIVFGEGFKKSLKEIITMPILWSIILGVIFAIYKIQIGPILYNTLNFIAEATIPISI